MSMENNHYLSIGTKVGGHYEIERVLGEDDFEILYLAKDLHKRGEYVVLKELFFKAYSKREGRDVTTLAKSKIIFEETKKEVIAEVEALLNNPKTDEISIYGTFEENNTLYTIMEFINNPNLDNYLKINNETEKKEEPLKLNTPEDRTYQKKIPQENISKKDINIEKKEKPKSSLFLKILMTSLLICIGLGYYAYNMIKEDKKKIKERPPKAIAVKELPKPQTKNLPTTKEELLNDYVEGSNEIEEDEDREEESIKETPEGAEYITDVESYKKEQEERRAKEEALKDAKEEAQKRALEEEKEKHAKEEDQERALEDEEERLREEEYRRMQEEALKDNASDNRKNHEEFIPKDIRGFIGEEEERSNHPENDLPPLSDEEEENLPLGAMVNTPKAQENQTHPSLGKRIQ
jgi:hypothetical protein